ncbi:alpha-methylacyl-CoA racemase [Microdochium nivale]|nr:alpha-methylacyl-CoA racemase [Microdochium nivale]
MEALLPLFPPDKSPYHWQTVDIHPATVGFLVIACIMHVVVYAVVAMRFYSRSMAAAVGWDDWWTLIATVLATGSLVDLICFDILGSGYPANEVAINLSTIMLLAFVTQPLFLLATAATKISVCCFYLRIFVGRSMRKAIYATMILVSVWVIASFIGQIFICTPIAGAYDLRLAAVVKCGDRPKFFQTDVSINVILDVIVIALPLWTIWNLNMSTLDKVGISIAFLVGLGMVIVGIIRAIYIIEVTLKGDITEGSPLNLFLMVFEQQLAIIVVSIPMLRPLWAKFRHRGTRYNLNDCNDNNPANMADRNELTTFGGSGGRRIKKNLRRDVDDSILNTRFDDRDMNTEMCGGRGRSDGDVGRYSSDVSDGHSVVSDWNSRGDAGSESRLDVNPSLSEPAIRNGGNGGDNGIILATEEWTKSRRRSNMRTVVC